jgi:5-methylcytosine-specific restriction endonuclease McrA
MGNGPGPRKPAGGKIDAGKLDKVVEQARKSREERERGYRELSLKLHPWICGRCGREFTRENLHLLTVHHKDHNHDNNPLDGSNWENLCIYCHDNEHSRYIDHLAGAGSGATGPSEAQQVATHNPFASLKDLLGKK